MSTVDWRFEERDCPICAGSRGTATRLGRRGGQAHGARRGVETVIVRCGRCHAVYQSPTAIPVGNPYAEHPPDDYFSQHDTQAKVRSGELLGDEAAALLGSPGRMLEIGCGCGEFLEGARNRGWHCAGVELTEAYAEKAHRGRGLPVEVADVLVARTLDQEWDVILMAAVLEHLYDPMAALNRVRKALRPGGLVYIDVPNECSLYTRVGNLYQRLRGRDWAVNLSPTFPPFHVVGFCPTSLAHALRAAGLEPVRLVPYAMENCMTDRAGRGIAALERASSRLVLRLGHAIGMSAGLLCWARRPLLPG